MAAKFGSGPEDFKQAEWLATALAGEWRYDHTAEKWHHWDGAHWAPDETTQIKKRVADLASEGIKEADTDDERKALLRLLSVAPQDKALEALASFPSYGTNGDDWDARPELLGVSNGIVDLRTNTLIEHPTPDMLVTRSTRVPFKRIESANDFDDAAPIFMDVMRQWMSGDPDMVAFLLLWFGASLFGFTPEQRFLLMTGVGRNGKGALKSAIMEAVGQYGAQFDANLYMASRFGPARSDQARADLLKLKGLRIAFFSEPQGNRFNEEMLKAHTGGDRITARALYSNNLQSWDPTHSITFLVNNAPEVDDLGPSMAARVMVADFRERYDGDKEDKQLYGKLKKEAPGVLGILCWAAAVWHTSWSEGLGGITLPARVVEQSRVFMERNDPVANWLNACAVFGPGTSSPSQVAYDSYKDWHRRSGMPEEPMSSVRWALELSKKGFGQHRTSAARSWTGFRLLGAMELAESEAADGE